MYKVTKKSDDSYEVLKDGSTDPYIVRRSGDHYECSCTGFKYRGTCKHLDLVKDQEEEKSAPQKISSGLAEDILKEILPLIRSKSDQVEIVGSLLRGCTEVKDIDLVVVPKNDLLDSWYDLAESLESSPNYERKVCGDSIIRGYYKGVLLDINRSSKSNLVTMKLYRTGSTQFNIKMRSVAKMKGYVLNEYGLYLQSDGSLVSRQDWTEKDYFDALGLEYVPAYKR